MMTLPILTDDAIAASIKQSLDQLDLTGKRVLVLIPDHTRTMRLPIFFRAICAALLDRVGKLDFMVALGTHPPLDDESLLRLVGISSEERAGAYREVDLLNHAWSDPNALVTLGSIPADEIAEISGGLLHVEAPVRLNRAVLEYDQLLICGPVFPHEVAGFSGGNKYFFPGIAGPEIIDLTHWLGALITCYTIIGTLDTPVRRVIDRAAAMIPTPRHALCVVISQAGVHGISFGAPEQAHREAAALSAQAHIRYLPRPYQRVLAVLPPMYDELWVGAKGMYKLEPIVADGGELIIYAPHLHEISETHGALIRQVGYHVRDYFALRWEQFKHLPWGVLAHSTHLRGAGSYDPATDIERPRVSVTLATGIPEAECHAVNLGYRDPAQIDPAAWAARGDPDVLVVFHAGEVLHRLERER
jgi:nickel-dependent lactate racemase